LKIAYKNTSGAAKNSLSPTGKAGQDKIRKFTLAAQQIRPANRTGGMLFDPPLLHKYSSLPSLFQCFVFKEFYGLSACHSAN
jgi:hypothetical protein